MLTSCPNKNTKEVQENQIVNLFESALFGSGDEGLQKENFVISSQEEWKEFLDKIDTTNKVSDRFESAIDFSKETVLVAVDGVKNTGGFGIKILDLKEEKDKVLITVTRKGPEKANTMVTMIITQPINIVKIKKTDKEIVFVEQ